jgi:hypothetical protein
VHLAAVHLAVVGIQDVAALPPIAFLMHAAQHRHADDDLVLALIRACRAALVGRLAGDESLHDLAAQHPVLIAGDLDEGTRRTGFIVDGLPESDGRAGLRPSGCADKDKAQCNAADEFHA